MAAPMLKRGLDICKFSRPGFRRIHAKTDKIIGNKKLYIGLPCACYAAVLALKKMTNSRNFVPVVNAAQPQQVRKKLPCFEQYYIIECISILNFQKRSDEGRISCDCAIEF